MGYSLPLADILEFSLSSKPSLRHNSKSLFMLKFNPFQAPVRYVFVDPDTGREFVGKTKEDLVVHIRNYRTQNELDEIDYLDMAIDDYLCRLPENAGKCGEMELKRGWFEWSTGAFNVIKNVFFGDKNIVDQSEAERRSKICLGCPYNIFPDRDNFIKFADGLAEAQTQGRKVSEHEKLGSCEVCTCSLRSKVFFKGPFLLRQAQKDKMKAVGCWQV